MKNLKIFKNSRVIVTGHTGFKGSWLTAWLKQLGANVMGISLDPPTYPSHFEASKINLGIKDVRLDIRDKVKLEQKITAFKPNFVFHLAAQSLVGLSYKNPTITWQTNVLGTLNVLESLRKLKNVCNVVIITSDKCYFNREIHYGYKETDILGGKDPYSGSKASAELLIKSYISSFFLNNKTNKNRILIITFFSILYVGFEMLVEYFTGFSLYSRIIENFFNYEAFAGGPHRLSGPFKDAPKSGIYLAYFLFPALIGITKIIKHKFTNSFSLIFGFIVSKSHLLHLKIENFLLYFL